MGNFIFIFLLLVNINFYILAIEKEDNNSYLNNTNLHSIDNNTDSPFLQNPKTKLTSFIKIDDDYLDKLSEEIHQTALKNIKSIFNKTQFSNSNPVSISNEPYLTKLNKTVINRNFLNVFFKTPTGTPITPPQKLDLTKIELGIDKNNNMEQDQKKEKNLKNNEVNDDWKKIILEQKNQKEMEIEKIENDRRKYEELLKQDYNEMQKKIKSENVRLPILAISLKNNSNQNINNFALEMKNLLEPDKPTIKINSDNFQPQNKDFIYKLNNTYVNYENIFKNSSSQDALISDFKTNIKDINDNKTVINIDNTNQFNAIKTILCFTLLASFFYHFYLKLNS